jgi:hypothetical protein
VFGASQPFCQLLLPNKHVDAQPPADEMMSVQPAEQDEGVSAARPGDDAITGDHPASPEEGTFIPDLVFA